MADESTALTTSDNVEVLPGPVDDETIERVVEKLKELHRGATLKLALDIGQIIIEDIYGSDLEAWRSRGVKDASFSKLAERKDLGMSRSTLHRAVCAYELSTRIGVSLRKHLSLTHLRAVFGLPHEDQERLLTQADEQGWTVAQLEAAAQGEEQPKRAGRPRLPGIVKGIRRLDKLTEDEALFGNLDEIDALDPEQVDVLLAKVRGVKLACERLQERLMARAGTGEE
ncbi:MAG: hypothetical protein H6716_24735 [Polyangiaceae bacterium]|nr:hypothetical protein [Polyangiaceae bacterium]